MKTVLMTLAITLFALNAWSAEQFLCKTSQGDVLFTFDPLTASWMNKDGSSTPFLKYGNICNQDVSTMNPRPSCRVKDQSADHYLIQTLECQHDGQWFADAFIEISQVTKDGRFQCKTKFGSHHDIKINFSECRR
jgi:hypothetical protein